MLIKNYMNKNIIYEYSNSTILNCIEKMRNKQIGFLLIRTPDNSLLGVVTDRDIMIGLIKYNVWDEIANIVKPNLIYLNENESLTKACDTCGYYQVTRLIIVNNNLCVSGIISIYDILNIDIMKDYATDSILEIKRNDIYLKYDLECDINLQDNFLQ